MENNTQKLIVCKCGKEFSSFKSAKRKYCSLACSGRYKPNVSFWKGKKMPESMKRNLSKSHKKMWDDGKMDNRKKLLGDLNHSKNPRVKAKIRKTHESNGIWTPLNQLSDWEFYKRNVLLMTNRGKAYENWDGKCYYCAKYIREEPKWSKLEPTIDHKTSIFFGFHNKLKEEDIAAITNLVISCRSCNCSKRENVR